jgi:outer membrane protein assembly factor BamB
MAKVIDIKCPKCSAPLPIPADAQTITCRYCGGTSVVERPGSKPIHAPPGQTVVHLPPSTGPLLAGALASGGVVVAITTAVVIANVASTAPQSGPYAAAGSPAEIAQAQAAATSYGFSDHPMLADVNGDGALDILGKVREHSIGEWIAAFDGTNGEELWRSQVLTKDATEGGSLRGVALGRVISVDALGKVQAYDLKTGSPAWSALLGETARSMCEADGVIVIETADEARHGLEPAGGKKREVAAEAPCKPVYSSDRDVNPGYRIIGWWDLEKHKLPGLHDTDGISAHRALVPTGPGPRFLLGGKSKGTSVAMVVAVGDKKKTLWKDVVPGVDPLTTDVNVTTQEAAYTEGVLVVPYNMKDRGAGTRMAAFDANTGTRLWDVAALNDQVSSGMAITPERVYIASWTTLVALSVKTGEVQFTIGK